MNGDSKHSLSGVPAFVREFLEAAEANNLRRTLRKVLPLSAREAVIDGRKCLNFSSNDYLGLTFHPALRDEAIRWTEKYGTGAAGSRLVTGTVDAYLELEEKIARWKQAEAAMILGSGYMANTGLIAAIADRKAVIFADKLNHASLNAGCQLSGAKFVRYRHNDMTHLEQMIERNSDVPVRIIISDTVFSMDGDVAEPEALRQIAAKYDCLLYLDDAHATGVSGENGEGLGCGGGAHIVMSTFSKAMGSYGACAVCSAEMKDYLVNRCGSFIYSTALPPGVCGSISAAVDLVQTDEFREIRRELHRRVNYLRDSLNEAGLDTGDSTTQIIPVIVGEAERALEISHELFDHNILAMAIRPPTVPRGTARIRVSLNAAHTDADVEYLLDNLKRAVRR